jgi:hypothetical protein
MPPYPTRGRGREEGTGAIGRMQAENTGVGGGAVATEETDGLIASDKVEGTAVYNRMGERPGTVQM